MSTSPGDPPTSAMDASHRPLHSMTTRGQANKRNSSIEAASLQPTDDREPTADEVLTMTDSHEPSVGVSRPPPMPVIGEALSGSKDAPTSSSDIMLLLQYLELQRKEDLDRQDRFQAKQLEILKAKEDRKATLQKELADKETTLQKANTIRNIEDKVRREREQAAKEISRIPKMMSSETAYACFSRIERTFIEQSVPVEMWVHGLQQILTGKTLEYYFRHAGSFSKDYHGLKSVILKSCGYSSEDLLDFVKPIVGYSIPDSSWHSECSFRFYELVKHCPSISSLTGPIGIDQALHLFSDVLASFTAVATLNLDGRAHISVSNPLSWSERMKVFETYTQSPAFKLNRSKNDYKYNKFSSNRTYNSKQSSSVEPDNKATTSADSVAKPAENAYCNYCKHRGHTLETCRTLQRKKARELSDKPANNAQQKVSGLNKLVHSDSEDDAVTSSVVNRTNGVPNKFNTLLEGKVNDKLATFELDSGAQVSLISPDLVCDKDRVPGTTSVSCVFKLRQVLPLVEVDIDIQGTRRRVRFGVSHDLDNHSVLLGSDLPKDDFCHFLLLAIHKPCSSVKITRAQARHQKSSEAEREHQQILDGAQPTDISVIDPLPDNSPPAIDHDTHTDSPQLSDDDVSVGVDFLSTGPVLAPHSVENTDSDNFEDACPSPLDSVSAKILCDVPLVQLNGIGRSGLCKLQASDTSLTDLRRFAKDKEKGYRFVNEVLMGTCTDHGTARDVIVLPQSLRPKVLALAHDHSGHFGIANTRSIINRCFTWPGLASDVRAYVQACDICQRNSKSKPAKAPLMEVDVITERCEKIALDVVGKLPRSKEGYSYILTAMDLATHFMFAFPMKGFTAEETATNFLKIIRDVGIPNQILTDQGSNFMSRVVKHVTDKFAINRIRTSPYHPESNGQLERFHSTLKSVIRKCIDNERNWPDVLDLAIFYLRNMPHRISGYTPFELHYGLETPHILATLKSFWTDPGKQPVNVTQYMSDLQNNLNTVLQSMSVRMNEARLREREKRDGGTLRTFADGSLVLWKTPGLGKAFATSWEGPYKVVSQVTPVTYKVSWKDGTKTHYKVIHINQLKPYTHEPDSHCHKVLTVSEECAEYDPEYVIPDHFMGENLSPDQKSLIEKVYSHNASCLTDIPGKTDNTTMSIHTTSNVPVWSPSYTIPVSVQGKFKEELDSLLSAGIIEPSQSEWSSPPIPVKKKDGSIRIVVDYRKLNSVTIPMPFYMPSTEEIISSLGNAKVMSKLDLAKGFHQVPVEEASRDLTTFSCKFGKFRYRRMPFGLRNAPSVFQLLMQRCLQEVRSCLHR